MAPREGGGRRRPHTLSFTGMVVSPHPLATLAGARILQDGGTAVDAAVAANAVLAVTLPHMCGPGGDAFFLIHAARERRVLGLNASGRAPAAATREAMRARGHTAMPVRGPLSITVPGAVDGWAEALRRCGSMGMKDVLAPAIRYARDGFPITPEVARAVEEGRDLVSKSPAGARVLLGRGALRPGDRLVNADLARSLEAIGEGGAEAFYRGDLGRALVRGLASHGALLAEEDLRAHRSDWMEPIHVRYRGHDVYQCPPNSQGITLLVMLNLLAGFDLAGTWSDELARLHAMVESKKLAFADRERYVTDPAFAPAPVVRLLSADYAEDRRRRIALDRAMAVPAPPGVADGDTVCVCAADGSGNWVCLIQSLYHPFGSGLMADGTGIFLHNRGCDFSMEPDEPNGLEPGKRTLHTLMPGLVMRDGVPRAVVGTRGGAGQPQTVASVLINWLDGGMSLPEAVEGPRWLHGARARGEDPNRLCMERRVAEEPRNGLAAVGHQVATVGAWDPLVGFCQGIEVDPGSGAVRGAADPRGDSLAMGI